ncbi:exodeoxyribonuclease VII large subunit [Proteiniclasticum sp. BAD-10]|uniref:Exodeoxyribonuclease 7 large subunit n=1 Tax=Proteiniclasticum sediminis TaxID=2804028 RepID=A0A941CLP8_9CLOT|nr:exodeoxyribonuclease VII large subunit [Proteiniclasticum sediminis]MBR0574955.1 exodeoxyribonuclease VII large subunit [Proteiniclasticum sediminis]
MKLKTMSVTDLNAYIKRSLDNDFILNNLTVLGELSNFKAHSSGHLYFSLKDENAKINAVMFRSDAERLKMVPKDGMKVVVRGRVSVYAKEGSYQLYAQSMEEVGLGEIYQEFERNKARLMKEGLFDEDIKRPLPPYPEKIAVVTSPTGAAIRDIMNVASRRNPGVSLVIYPTLVQGEEARKSLVNALERLRSRKDIDLVILARGGGAMEDLAAFNDLDLAYAIRKSPVPVITGIGHEVDFTIADFVADRRLATPSQAAEVAIPALEEMQRALRARTQHLQGLYTGKIRVLQAQLQGRAELLAKNSPKMMLAQSFRQVEESREKLDQILQRRIEKSRSELLGAWNLLQAHSPLKILDKGYALVYGESGELLRSVTQLDQAKILTIRLRDGQRTVEVRRTDEKENRISGTDE